VTVATLSATFMTGAFGAGPALAEIADYMILRLVYLETSCGALRLARSTDASLATVFEVECRNLADYPAGLRIICPDGHDDRLCRIATPPQTFDNLELLQPRGKDHAR